MGTCRHRVYEIPSHSACLVFPCKDAKMACSKPASEEYTHFPPAGWIVSTSTTHFLFLTVVFWCRLKALISIPKVQPRFAVAIWKKYPTMRSLLNAYMDPSKSVKYIVYHKWRQRKGFSILDLRFLGWQVHEKEFLLKDLKTEGLLGQEERRVGEICSKRVYRILTARSGNIKTDDVEDGADFFEHVEWLPLLIVDWK